jgi:hypothetical protein
LRRYAAASSTSALDNMVLPAADALARFAGIAAASVLAFVGLGHVAKVELAAQHFSQRYCCASKHGTVQLMTAGMVVHVTNRVTPGSE